MADPDKDKLAADYEALLFGPGEDIRANETLVREADLKLITPNTTAIKSPMIAAVNDLMWMREGSSSKLTKAGLMAQKGTFAEHPELFTYLQAAFALYVENNPASALQLLPDTIPAELNYTAFSQQMLRGLALEANQIQRTRRRCG